MTNQNSGETSTGHAGIGYTHVANDRVTANLAEQADIHGPRPVNRQSGDGVSKTIEGAGKRTAVIAHGRKAAATIPSGCCSSVNVCTQGKLSGQAACHALQVCARCAAGGAERGRIQHVVSRSSIRKKSGSATAPKVNSPLEAAARIDADIDGSRTACCPIRTEAQYRCASRAHDGINIKAGMRSQGQGVGIPRNVSIDVNDAGLTARGRIGGQDADVARAQGIL